MLKASLKIGVLLASALAVSGSASALAQRGGNSPYEELYERYYYDDAAMTVQVGYEYDTCTYYGKGGSRTQGRYGPYVQENLIGACENGQPVPIQ